MNNWTILLLRPDYLADEFGKDTYLAHVVANSAKEAMAKAQREAFSSDLEQDADDESCDSPTDYHVLFCTMGHLRDMSLDQE